MISVVLSAFTGSIGPFIFVLMFVVSIAVMYIFGLLLVGFIGVMIVIAVSIFAVVAVILGIVGLVFGVRALIISDKNNDEQVMKRGLLGVCLNGLGLGFYALTILLFILAFIMMIVSQM